jgi:hypothetical protein
MLAAVVGVSVGLLLVIMDGVAAPQLAEEWATAPPTEQTMALRVLSASETVNFSVASLFNLIFAGATFIFFGLALAVGQDYPRWLGLVAVAAGVLSIGAGLVQAYNGEPTEASRLLTIIGPTVITFWLLVVGVMLIRRTRITEAIQ